jgi:membrane-associated phospholipid phosphatase
LASTSARNSRPLAPQLPRPLGNLPARIALAALPFALAFTADLATDRRYSMYLGSAAILLSLLALSSKARRLAIPVGAYAGVWVAFNAARAIADKTPWTSGTIGLVARAEAAVAGGDLPGATLQHWLYTPGSIGLLDLLLALVYLSYFVVPHAVGVWLLARSRDRFWRYVALSGLLFAIGLLGFALLPTAPPWQASAGEPHRIVHELMNGASSHPAYGFDPNPVASMPSIHLGVTAFLIPLARRGGWRAAAIVYTALMGLALVYLGEHYVVDALAGAATASLAWRLMAALDRRRGVLTRRRSVPRMRQAARRSGG